MAYSTIPLAKATLLATLQSDPDLDGVVVEWGIPAEPHPNREAVYIGDAQDVTREWAQIGQYRIDESYNLHVLVEVYREGTDEQGTEERMWEIVARVERAVVADLTLAGVLAGPGHAKPGRLEPRTVRFDAGFHAFCGLRVECSARITSS